MDGVQSTQVQEQTAQKEQIAKEYGLNLENIKHIKMEDGKEFFQFTDPKTKEIKMVENINYNSTLKDQFEESQKSMTGSQGENAAENAENMFKHNLKYKNKELELVTIEEFKANKYRYKKKMRELDTIIRNKIIALLSKIDDLELKYINLENGFGIDEKNNIIDVKYDFKTNKAEFVEPTVISYTSSLQETSELNDEDIDLDNIDFEGLLDEMGIVDNVPVETEGKVMNVNGVTIDSKTVAQAYDTPEIIDRNESLSNNQRTLLRAIVERIRQRLARRNGNQVQRQFVLTNNNNNNNNNNQAA